MPPMRRALPCALAALGLSACGAGPGAVLGPAPDFTLRTVEGETFRLGDHAGESVVVLVFWTSVCANCKTELTRLQALYDDLKDDGLLVVAVSLDDSATVGAVRPTRDRLGLTFPVVLDEESIVAGLYNPRAATPFTVVIDGAGRRVYAHEGFVAGDFDEIESTIRARIEELRARARARDQQP